MLQKINKINIKNNIKSLINFLLLYLILSINSYADNLILNNNSVTLGKDSALIKIKIFSSFTCPHCAIFHLNIVPKIKSDYVNSGKVQLIFIDFPLDQAAFNASKLLHCVNKKKQISFMDYIYENQDQWTQGSTIEDIDENLKKVVKNLGISSDKFEKCLTDEAISDKILNLRINSQKKYSIESTPTIVINEKKLEGSVSFKNIKKKIEKLI